MYLGLDLKFVNEVYYAPDEGLECVAGDHVIARTVRAKEIARVLHLRPEIPAPLDEGAFVKRVLRKAGEKDFQREQENRAREAKAFLIAAKKIERLTLPMKLIRVHYLFDHSRIIFFFKAANKVDFRQLVRDLAAVFKTRIELRQIGVRDEAKILGGTGSCGRELCCSSFLRSFDPVTVKMAKLQHHTVNPSKISGQCGRLKCCIAYECPYYEDALRGVPPIGAEVSVGEAVGRVVKLNVFNHRAEVLKGDGTAVEIAFDQIRHCRYVQTEPEGPILGDEDRLDFSDPGESSGVAGPPVGIVSTVMPRRRAAAFIGRTTAPPRESSAEAKDAAHGPAGARDAGGAVPDETPEPPGAARPPASDRAGEGPGGADPGRESRPDEGDER